MSCSCPICFENIEDTNKTITSCGHSFHSSCIIKYVATRIGGPTCPKCPCCRTQLYEYTSSAVNEEHPRNAVEAALAGLNNPNLSRLEAIEVALIRNRSRREAVESALAELGNDLAELDNHISTRIDDSRRGRVNDTDEYLGAHVISNPSEPYPYYIHPVDGTVRRTDTITRIESTPWASWSLYIVDGGHAGNNAPPEQVRNNNTREKYCIIT